MRRGPLSFMAPLWGYRFGQALLLALHELPPRAKRTEEVDAGQPDVFLATLALRRVAEALVNGKLEHHDLQELQIILCPGVPVEEQEAATNTYKLWRETYVAGGARVVSGRPPRQKNRELWIEICTGIQEPVIGGDRNFWIVGLAWHELIELIIRGEHGPALGRCPAPGPWGRGTCGRWYINMPRGKQREYCSKACARRAARWVKRRMKRAK